MSRKNPLYEELIFESHKEQMRIMADAWSMEYPNEVYDEEDNITKENHKRDWFLRKFNVIEIPILNDDKFEVTINQLTTKNKMEYRLKKQKEVAKEGQEDPRFKMLGEQIDEMKHENESLRKQLAELSAFFLGVCAKRQKCEKEENGKNGE